MLVADIAGLDPRSRLGQISLSKIFVKVYRPSPSPDPKEYRCNVCRRTDQRMENRHSSQPPAGVS